MSPSLERLIELRAQLAAIRAELEQLKPRLVVEAAWPVVQAVTDLLHADQHLEDGLVDAGAIEVAE